MVHPNIPFEYIKSAEALLLPRDSRFDILGRGPLFPADDLAVGRERVLVTVSGEFVASDKFCEVVETTDTILK